MRPYRGESRDEWEHVHSPEDVAGPEPLDQCQGCDEAVHEDDLTRWAGERRCPDCCHLCPVCKDVEVTDENEFCNSCAYWSLGVEV